MTARQVTTVLIVDDSATARMIIQQCMEIAGFRDACFLQAANGRAAVSLLRQQPVDLVLTDLNMPEMDGRQLLEVIRGAKILDAMLVVVITSAANEARERELRQLGANYVVAKPVSPVKLAQMQTELGILTKEVMEYGGHGSA